MTVDNVRALIPAHALRACMASVIQAVEILKPKVMEAVEIADGDAANEVAAILGDICVAEKRARKVMEKL